jgi:hypothetical protein
VRTGRRVRAGRRLYGQAMECASRQGVCVNRQGSVRAGRGMCGQAGKCAAGNLRQGDVRAGMRVCG